jgi:hypothetical protein
MTSLKLKYGMVFASSIFPIAVTLFLSDRTHSIAQRARVSLPMYPIWLIIFFLIFRGREVTIWKVGVTVFLFAMALWSCPLDYSMINTLSIQGLPILSLIGVLFALLIMTIKRKVKNRAL